MKAFSILQEKFNLPPVKIHLHKIIPIGAGLGGGSSDAAFMIKILNDLFGLKMSNEKMQEIAKNLGSDCPFFIENEPVYATDKGDVFENVSLRLSGFHILLVKPDIHVSTPEAYSMIVPKASSFSLKNIDIKSIHEWKDQLKNDFEIHIFKKYPEIKIIREKLYESGAVYASMSGSGSAVYGIFEKPVTTGKTFDNYYTWQGQFN